MQLRDTACYSRPRPGFSRIRDREWEMRKRCSESVRVACEIARVKVPSVSDLQSRSIAEVPPIFCALRCPSISRVNQTSDKSQWGMRRQCDRGVTGAACDSSRRWPGDLVRGKSCWWKIEDRVCVATPGTSLALVTFCACTV